MNKIYVILFLSFICINICGASNDSRKAFIKKYKSIAIEEMDRTGIPASIKLAQGMLESGCGTSKLAINANNHFGIKCHNWNGASFTMDDDRRNECFRKYRNPEESWVDHTIALVRSTSKQHQRRRVFPCVAQPLQSHPHVHPPRNNNHLDAGNNRNGKLYRR